jgi:hypothetical protein
MEIEFELDRPGSIDFSPGGLNNETEVPRHCAALCNVPHLKLGTGGLGGRAGRQSHLAAADVHAYPSTNELS